MGRTGVLGVALALLLVAVTLVSPFAPALRGVARNDDDSVLSLKIDKSISAMDHVFGRSVVF
jgi:hypothetical protein